MESSRISLRAFRETDVDDVMTWISDDRVTRAIRWDTLNSKQEALTFIKEVCIPQPWHVSICIDDRSIGFLWVVYPLLGPDKDQAADIGYAIAVEYWGQGIATKALKMAIPKVFNDFPGIVKLQAFATLENKASHRVLEKAGFLYQDSLTVHGNFKGKVDALDLVIYSLLSKDVAPPSS
ncbi:uncharacterized protein LOC132645233 [Lycium barbarum]|uniref:uncharacterized protein LOC132645233 n=1 Tax=Lycium barbarum TaxID=112863 RepID=UPI00293F0632|nr:uncharacterized protein LOC132645233 [Lycium barbarum]